MPNVPRISIVTPSFNQGKFLEETICSVLDQHYPNLEYILVDGGSKDESLEIIKKYSDQLTYWVSEPDRGQSHAINKGFALCTGEILAWINSDDIYTPGSFEFVSDYFGQNPEVDLVYGDAEIIDEHSKFLMHRKELPTDYLMGNLIGWGFIIPQPAAFWQRRVLEQIGKLDEELYYAIDYDYWQRIAAGQTLIQHTPRLLARQRYHMDAKTLNYSYDPRPKVEINALREQAYSRLGFQRVLPYSFAPLLRNIYRVKRIFLRFINGHYFKGYIPDPLLRKRMSNKINA